MTYHDDATTTRPATTAGAATTATAAPPPRDAFAARVRLAGGGEATGFSGPDAPRPRSAARAGTVALMVVALLAAAGLRHVAVGIQRGDAAPVRRSAASGTSLAGMDSYAIALLLGGLRGPLVMVLWANSEAQKVNRDLEGVDTQIEWIRLLQPEFDSVHRFQMWNKAYNLSVQMVGLGNKYTTILDALHYGHNVDAERPDNVNILKQIGSIYSEKLGNSYPERLYYRERLRRETRHREQPGVGVGGGAGAGRGRAEFQRLQHDPLLDPQGNVLPQYLVPRRPRPAGLPPDAEYDEGSDLQFLPQFQPYPYGLSPYALGYNYHKRAQVLSDRTGDAPTQETQSVVDAQPAVTLKAWAEEEWERGRRLEAKAFGLPLPLERLDQELATAELPTDGSAPVRDPAALAEALYAYDFVARLTDASRVQFDRHLSKPEFLPKRTLYASHLDTLTAMKSMTAADATYLRALGATGAERAELARRAAAHYRDAIRNWGLITLRYYTDVNVTAAVFPPGLTRGNIGTGGLGSNTAVTEAEVRQLLAVTRREIQRRGGVDENAGDRTEYDTYIARSLRRLEYLDAAGAEAGTADEEAAAAGR